MSPDSLLIGFADASTAEGNRLANCLGEALRDIGAGIIVRRQRVRPDAQDFGASLAVILGTAAVTAVSKGLAARLARNGGARVEIRRKGRLVLSASHLDSKDVSHIVKALSSED